MTTTYKWQAGLLCALAVPALVALPQQSFAQEEELIEEIITTGTRRADRSAADSPVAIDVIGATEFAQNSSADVQDMLRTSVPSFDVNTQPISELKWRRSSSALCAIHSYEVGKYSGFMHCLANSHKLASPTDAKLESNGFPTTNFT